MYAYVGTLCDAGYLVPRKQGTYGIKGISGLVAMGSPKLPGLPCHQKQKPSQVCPK